MIYWLARFRGAQPKLKILDSWVSEQASETFSDNFGAYHFTQSSTMFPADARGAADLSTIVSPSNANNLPLNFETVASEKEAISQYVNHTAVSVSYLSLIAAPKLDIRHGRWSGSFNLVVGEDPSDRILFWNARLLLPGWLDNDLNCLRVTMEELRDPEFAKIVDSLLKRRNVVNGGSGGPTQITIRSTSESIDTLNEVVAILRSLKPWAVLSTEVVSLEDMMPSGAALALAARTTGYESSAVGRQDWVRFSWTDNVARPPIELPQHLRDAPTRQSFTDGYWAVDLALEYDGTGLRLGGDNQWSIPKQWRLAGAFEVSFKTNGGRFLGLKRRRNRQGNLSVAVNAQHPIEQISIPTADEAMRHAFVVDGAHAARIEESTKEVLPPSRVSYFEPSNEARYLAGVLGMTNGLERASQYLLHPFLRKMLAKLGGTPSLDAAKVAPVINRLKKRSIVKPMFDVRQHQERAVLGDLIVKAAHESKKPSAFVDLKELKKDWAEYVTEYMKDHDSSNLTEEELKQHEAYERDALKFCLVELRKRKLLFQGHEWLCPECHHRNWIDFSSLAIQLSCEVCSHSEQAPVEIEWLFRPNEFLIDSLANHSILSLVWTLDELRSRSRSSFIYLGPTAFYFERDDLKEIDAEADLLAIIDGRSYMCEVKSSWSTLRRSEELTFVDLAKRLRPDVALLAVMERAENKKDEISRIEEELKEEGIAFELLMPRDWNNHDGPFLPHD